MLRAVALDDEPLALSLLQTLCAGMEGIYLVRTFTSPTETVKFLQAEPVDLLFLDVQMPTITGIEFFALVPKGVAVILTTAHAAHAVAAFDLRAADYLLKPFTPERFAQAVARVQEQRGAPQPPQVLTVRLDHGLRRIPLDDILYVEALDDYLRIHLTASQSLLVRMTLKAAEQALPSPAFIRIHRSYLVALAHVTALRGRTVLLGATALPVGQRYEGDLRAHFAV